MGTTSSSPTPSQCESPTPPRAPTPARTWGSDEVDDVTSGDGTRRARYDSSSSLGSAGVNGLDRISSFRSAIKLDPNVKRSLKRLYSSTHSDQSTTSSRGTHDTGDTDDTQHSSTITDVFVAQVKNMACAYGKLNFLNGAVFQGIVCNRVENLNGRVEQKDAELQPPATFLTAKQECLHGIWILDRLQYDLDLHSPVAIYLVDIQVLCQDASVHVYKGPVRLVLKKGIVQLPLDKTLLVAEDDGSNHGESSKQPKDQQQEDEQQEFDDDLDDDDENDCAANDVLNETEKESPFDFDDDGGGDGTDDDNNSKIDHSQEKGKEEDRRLMLAIGSSADESELYCEELKYHKYALISPRLVVTNGKRIGIQRFRSIAGPTIPVRRDHRMLFWNLCGKEMAPSKWDSAINSDLHRTHFHRFLDRSEAIAKEQLHSILRYVAIAFPTIGYCQGMHCIAKYLLMFSEAPIEQQSVSPTPTDVVTPKRRQSTVKELSSTVMLETETAFVFFAQLLEDEKYRMQDLFEPSFSFFKEVLETIDTRLASLEPVLHDHLTSCGLSAIVYASKWILTLFTFYVDQDFASVTNVWLRFLSQGWDAILDVSVACVLSVKEHLMNSDSERCMMILAGTTEVTPHGVLESLFGTPRGQALLKTFESTHHRTRATKKTNKEVFQTESEEDLRSSSPEPLSSVFGRAIPTRRYTQD